MTQRKIQYWVIPPKANGEFAAAMENVLETYARPYDPRFPVLTMDEQPVQLLNETRQPIPATKSHPRRIDYEYERAGTASVFLFAEPLGGWREVRVREQRTKIDWAVEMASLLRTRYAKAERVIVVCDNLNTHTMGAFYEAFAAEEARALVRRLEFCYTPKHGSWLNVAENELSSLHRQCLRHRRFRTIVQLSQEVAAWSTRSNEKQRGVDWQFRIDDARTKLKSLYPNITPLAKAVVQRRTRGRFGHTAGNGRTSKPGAVAIARAEAEASSGRPFFARRRRRSWRKA